MASITIRNLDESVKKARKMRAAANNRSMEEEARLILRCELMRETSGESLVERIRKIWANADPEGLAAIIPPRDQTPYEPRVRFDEEDE